MPAATMRLSSHFARRRRRRIAALRFVVAAWVLVAGVAAAPASQPSGVIADHVLVIGIDGLGGEGVRRAKMPILRGLIERGAHTLTARAVMPTVSSPNWASMIMGAGPEEHGVTSNDWEPSKHDIPPVARGSGGIFPTMFGELRRQRRSAVIGVFHDWDGFGRLLERDALDLIVDGDGPVATVDSAIAFLRDRRPTLTFVHLDQVDHAGHEAGWMSAAYLDAMGQADLLIGRLIAALDEANMRSRTLILITADHGGVGTKHGGLTLAEIEIPWILTGPTVRRGYTLSLPVSTIDTAPTVLWALGFGTPRAWIGRPVVEAFKVP
jgi:predicted AlkP superfamily pyrophosphatase or phosphodiesterase